MEDLQSKYELSRRQARDRLAALKVKPKQFKQKKATKVTRLVEETFPALADADRQAIVLKYFTRA